MLLHQLVAACGLLRSRTTAAGAVAVRPTVASREALAMFHEEEYIGQ